MPMDDESDRDGRDVVKSDVIAALLSMRARWIPRCSDMKRLYRTALICLRSPRHTFFKLMFPLLTLQLYTATHWQRRHFDEKLRNYIYLKLGTLATFSALGGRELSHAEIRYARVEIIKKAADDDDEMCSMLRSRSERRRRNEERKEKKKMEVNHSEIDSKRFAHFHLK